MAFTAADVKKLREMTNVGMMDCKKALTESDGDMDKAVEWLREMGLAGLIHKGMSHEATTVTASQVFDMATVNGAKALGLGDVTGEIKVGKKADLSLFDLSSSGFFPLGDPKSALVYSNAGLKADTVFVNGVMLLDNGKFTTIDAERVRYEITKLQDKLDRR